MTLLRPAMSIEPVVHDSISAFEQFKQLAGSQLAQVLELFVMNSFDSVLITSAGVKEHRILFANPVFCKMTGYTLDEIIGAKPSILSGEKTNPKIIERLRKNLEEGEPFRGAAVNYRKDGTEYYVDWNVHHVKNAQGDTLFYISIQKDLTNLRHTLNRLKTRNKSFKSFLSELVSLRKGGQQDLDSFIETTKEVESESLKDEARLFAKSLRKEEHEALFDDELFDFSVGETGVMVEEEARPSVSAKEFLHDTPALQSDMDALGECISDLKTACDLEAHKKQESRATHDIIAELETITDLVFYIEEFSEIAAILSELGLALSSYSKNPDDLFLTIMRAMAKDLQTWFNDIFVDQSVDDIHWMDASLIGSGRQLVMMIK